MANGSLSPTTFRVFLPPLYVPERRSKWHLIDVFGLSSLLSSLIIPTRPALISPLVPIVIGIERTAGPTALFWRLYAL
jgi:hypothetical protein